VQVNITIATPPNNSGVPSTFQTTGTVSPNAKVNVRAYLINASNQQFYGLRLDGATTNWVFQFLFVPPAWHGWVTLTVTGVDGTDSGSDSINIQVGP